MSKMFRIVMVLVVAVMAVGMAGCQGDEEKVAQKICDCSQPGLELQEKMEAAGTDQQKMGELMEEYEAVLANMIECQQEIEEEYSDKLEDQAFGNEVANKMFDICPDIAKQIELPVNMN